MNAVVTGFSFVRISAELLDGGVERRTGSIRSPKAEWGRLSALGSSLEWSGTVYMSSQSWLRRPMSKIQ